MLSAQLITTEENSLEAPWWVKVNRLLILGLCVLIVLPLLAVSLFSLTSYLNDLALTVSPLSSTYTVKLVFALRAVTIALIVSLSYYWISDWLARKVCGSSLRGIALKDSLQPWLFVGPAIVLLLIFLVIPTFETFSLSLMSDVPDLDPSGAHQFDENGQLITRKGFVGLSNYDFLIHNVNFWLAIRNSVLWLVIVPTACIVLGMLAAVLADRITWGTLAKSLIFVPLAISFVGAAVIWRNIYAAGLIDTYQIGLLNALLEPFGVEPRFWYETEFWGNFFMMSILVWIQTGFAMVIFSAALRSISEETLEAARIDGASERQIFFRITLPQIYGTIVVVWTTLVILVLKVFDIPYALTANKPDKLLLATLMEQLRTAQREEEQAAAVAIVLMLTILPIMIFNIRRTRSETAGS